MGEKPKLLDGCFEDYSARLDWRYQRALALWGDKEEPVTGFDDVYTIRGYKFIIAFQETKNISQRQLLRQRYANEMRVYDYFLHEDARKHKLEALCLCRDLSQQDIASMLGESVAVINLFEKLFFDIRGKELEVLYGTLFPPNIFKTILGTDLSDKIWKFFAIVGGFRLLNCLINPYTIDDMTARAFEDLGNRQLRVDFGVAKLIQPIIHRGDLKDITEAAQRLKELDIKEKEATGTALPEAQSTILKRCIDAAHVQLMSPDLQLEGGYEPTIEEMLSQGDAVVVEGDGNGR